MINLRGSNGCLSLGVYLSNVQFSIKICGVLLHLCCYFCCSYDALTFESRYIQQAKTNFVCEDGIDEHVQYVDVSFHINVSIISKDVINYQSVSIMPSKHSLLIIDN